MTRTLALLAAAACGAFGQRQVAITIDDLPLGGAPPHNCEAAALGKLTSQLLAPLRAEGAPVTGFVIGQNCPESFAISLRLWAEAGYQLGNHTYSHHDLNETSLKEFEADTVRGEKAVTTATGQKPKYFRHPFLHTGGTPEKRAAFEKFLAGRGYKIAPVTLDNSDWMFAAIYGGAQRRGDAALAKKVKDAYVPYMESIFEFFESRSMEVVGREFPQILLLHVSQLNADCMPELLRMMKRRGYRFVSLEAALEDGAYRLADTYSGRGGVSWIHRWSATKGMPKKGEPDEPKWISEAFQEQQKGKD